MARQLKGKIVSNKMQNTAVVEVSRLKKHPIYGKYMKISKRYKVHVDAPVNKGDVVMIESVKPISKDKRWKIINRHSDISKSQS